jgi:hypothetical protein
MMNSDEYIHPLSANLLDIEIHDHTLHLPRYGFVFAAKRHSEYIYEYYRYAKLHPKQHITTYTWTELNFTLDPICFTLNLYKFSETFDIRVILDSLANFVTDYLMICQYDETDNV